MMSPVQSRDPCRQSRVYQKSTTVERICWKGAVLSLEWKSEGVMDAESGDDDKDGLTSEREGESRHDWWGWGNESGSWFQRRGAANLNEWSVIFHEEMVGGRERVTTDEERVLRGGW